MKKLLERISQKATSAMQKMKTVWICISTKIQKMSWFMYSEQPKTGELTEDKKPTKS